MFNTNLTRSLATLGVIAGLLAVAGPASAKTFQGTSDQDVVGSFTVPAENAKPGFWLGSNDALGLVAADFHYTEAKKAAIVVFDYEGVAVVAGNGSGGSRH